MLWKYCGHIISKKNCGAEIEGKKKVTNWFVTMALSKKKKKGDKLICGNSITEIDHNNVICGNDITKNTLTNW